jgi:hypothetical protein
MSQSTINQRVKFLLEHYKLSVRAFSELIGHKAANTQNYVGTRESMPGADYLQSIIEHFEGINPAWLLTGRGEPFLATENGPIQTGNFNQAGTGNKQTIKGNKGTVQNNTGSGNTITNNVKLDSCQRDLATAQKEIALLTSQLADKERTIQILLKQNS